MRPLKKPRRSLRGRGMGLDLLKKLAFELGPKLLEGPVTEIGSFVKRKLSGLLGNGMENPQYRSLEFAGGAGAPYFAELQQVGRYGQHAGTYQKGSGPKKKTYRKMSNLNA